GRGRHRGRRRAPAGARRGAPLVASPGGLRLQPPERGRHAAPLQAAAARLRGRREAGGAAKPALRPRLRARGHGVHRPLRPPAGDRGAPAGDRGAPGGTSLVIAPEGTRSPTPRLGPFKKGAFHMAMGAGVPIVPIVFRNSLDALPKHGLVIRPATVEVVVHPPVPTEGWRVETLERHVAEVRALFVETLEG